jgi:quinol monooxygenase YgiN
VEGVKAMHIAIRRYQVDPGSMDEIMRQVNEGFIPIIKDAQGFLAYYALDDGQGELATVSVFEDRAGAEESISRAADYIRENLASLLPNPPEITAGEVRAHELSLTKLGIREVKE